MTFLPKSISGLSQIASQYDAVLCDVWGVIHNGCEPFEASVNALIEFRKTRGLVILITNSPRPGDQIPAQFDEIGVSHDCYDAIVTSGDATRYALKRRAFDPVFVLGPDRDLHLYEGLDLTFVELDQAKFISCTGLFDDRNETPNDYRELLSRALERDLPMICANPDIEVMIGNQRIWCGGALAQMYQQMGGSVTYSGKPYQPIYDLCAASINKEAGRAVDLSRVLAIGDGIGTDIKGEQLAGIDALFVATGIHNNSVDESGNIDQEKLAEEFAQQKTQARFCAPGLIW